MPTRTLLLLALTLIMPSAWAQDASRRVEREANNPMRMIIEAAKIRPKARASEAAKPAPRVAAESVAAPIAATAPIAVPIAVPPTEQAAAEATSAADPPPPAGPPESTVATVEVSAAPRSGGAPETAPPAVEPAPAPSPLKLANVVEPVTPRRLIGVLRGEVQVQVVFTVNADGSVADAAVRRSSHPAMDAAVLDAVSQWRYEPIASARPHEVQLVLRQPD